MQPAELQRVLRSERGLTYGASAEYQALKQAGDFAANTDTRSDATAEVLKVIVEEITKLQRERVSDALMAGPPQPPNRTTPGIRESCGLSG